MQCQRRGCAETATHALKLCVPRHGQDDSAMHFGLLMAVELCEEHADDADAGDFLAENPDLQRLFLVGMSNGPAPDFDRAYAVGVPVTDPEYLALKLNANRTVN